MDNKKLRKLDRVRNVVKVGAKITKKGFQKVQPILNKVKPIINPRNAAFGFILAWFLKPSVLALAALNPVLDVPESPSWTENLTVSGDDWRKYLL